MEESLLARLWLLTTVLGLFTSPALAFDAALHVEPGATCVNAATLRMQIDAWLGQAPRGRDLAIEVTGSPVDPRVIGFELREGARLLASRTFDPGPSACAQLEASLALSIALALKASLLTELLPERPHWRFASGLAGVALFGLAPRTPLGTQATFDAALGRQLWLRVGLGLWAAGNNPLPLGRGRFDLRAFWLRSELCGTPVDGARWSVFGCAGTRIGGLWARGERLPTETRVRDPWVALSAGFGAELRLSQRWSVELYAGMVASVARSRFELRARDGQRLDAYTISTFASELNLGPRLRF